MFKQELIALRDQLEKGLIDRSAYDAEVRHVLRSAHRAYLARKNPVAPNQGSKARRQDPTKKRGPSIKVRKQRFFDNLQRRFIQEALEDIARQQEIEEAMSAEPVHGDATEAETPVTIQMPHTRLPKGWVECPVG